MVRLALIFIQIFIFITLNAQRELSEIVKFCCSEGLTTNIICNKFDKKKGQIESGLDLLDVLANISQKIATESPDYENYYPGLYQTSFQLYEEKSPNRKKYKKPEFYLRYNQTSTKLAAQLFEAGFLNEYSQKVLTKEIEEKRLLHPYYVTVGAMLLVINETFRSKEILTEVIDLFSEHLDPSKTPDLNYRIRENRANLYSVFGAIKNYKPVKFKRPKSPEDLIEYLTKETFFPPYKLTGGLAEQEVVWDSIIGCGGYAYTEKKMIVRFKQGLHPFEFACPTAWQENPPRLLEQELFRSHQWLSLLSQLRRDYNGSNQRVVFVEAAKITESLLGKYGIEDISAPFLMYRLRPFQLASKGWWLVSDALFQKIREQTFTLSNGWELPILDYPDYPDGRILRSSQKQKIFKVIESSGVLDRYTPSHRNKWKREFTTTLFTDTISILNHFNLLAVHDPLTDCFRTIEDLYADNPSSIAVLDFMKCISYNDMVVDNFRIDKNKSGTSQKLFISFKGNPIEHEISLTGSGNKCNHVFVSVARLWKKHGKSNRQFFYLPNMSHLSAPYVLYLSPEEAYQIQEGLNYLIRSY